MSEIFDTTDVPDDDAHWDALAGRVAAGAIAANHAGRPATPRALWIGVSLAFAASLVAMIVSGQRSPPRDDATIRMTLAPTDGVGRTIALADAPPTVGELVLGRTAGETP